MLSDHFRAYLDHETPRYPFDMMIHQDEKRFLSYCAKNIWEYSDPDMMIVDAGCFLGASTLALADGLSKANIPEAARTKKILSYDLFMATKGMCDTIFKSDNIEEGQSFRRLYDKNIESYRHYIEVHEGDFLQEIPPRNRISMLFVDILWSWSSERHLSEKFYPLLVPRKSLLIHQDFVFPFYPWIILSMGLASDTFQFAYNVQCSTVVFDVLKHPIEIPDPSNISLHQAIDIYDEFISKLTGWAAGSLALGKALYMASRGCLAAAEANLEMVRSKYADESLVTQYIPHISYLIKQANDTGVPPNIANLPH